jgi:MFS transporter, DHA1 family, solute carrier family 18 (vesicular amine transporter), member 1/2
VTGILVAITTAFFTDGFLYGLLIPLARHSPAAITDDWRLGMSYGGYALGVILATPLLGVLSDRLGRRKPLLWGLCFQALAIAIFAFANGFPQLILARMAQGAAAGATWTGGLAMLAERFRLNRAQMMGVAMMGNTCGLVVGPILGGLLFDWQGYQASFVVAAVLLGIDGILRWTFIHDSQSGRDKSQVRSLLLDRGVLMTSFVIILGSVSWSVIEALLPGHLEQVAKASPAAVGAVFTLSSLAFAFSSPALGALVDRYGPWPTMTASLLLTAILLPAVTYSEHIVGIAALLALVGIANGLTMNTTLSELGEAVDRNGGGAYASGYAIYNIAYSIGMASGDAAAGAIASAISLKSAFYIVAAWLLFGAVLVRGFRSLVVASLGRS